PRADVGARAEAEEGAQEVPPAAPEGRRAPEGRADTEANAEADTEAGREEEAHRRRDLGSDAVTPALLVVVVGALASAAPPSDALAELTVEVSRPHLVLGEDDGADVTVSVGGVGEVGDVRLFTNVGRTLELRRVGEWRFL